MQTILNKAIDGLAMATLHEMAATLRGENSHTAAMIAESLGSSLSVALTTLAACAELAQITILDPAMSTQYSAYDSEYNDPLDGATRLARAGYAAELEWAEHLIMVLSRKNRRVMIVAVEYVRDRISELHAALRAVADLWAALVPPVEYFMSGHPALIGAYRTLNHLPVSWPGGGDE